MPIPPSVVILAKARIHPAGLSAREPPDNSAEWIPDLRFAASGMTAEVRHRQPRFPPAGAGPERRLHFASAAPLQPKKPKEPS